METSESGSGLQPPVGVLCGRLMGEGWKAVQGLWEGWDEKQGGLFVAETKRKEEEQNFLVKCR